MAVTITFLRAGQHHAFYNVVHDGAAGDTATITGTGGASPDLRTDIPINTPLGEMIRRNVVGAMPSFNLALGGDPGKVTVLGQGAIPLGQWNVRAAEVAGALELIVTGEAGIASGCLVILERIHSIGL